MRCQFAFVVVGTMLIAAPELANAAQRSDRIDALLQIATGVGHVIGAASVCREISWSRIKSLTDRFSDLIKVSVTQGEVFSSIQQAYDQSAIEGQRTVSSKNTDCAAAVRKHAGTVPLPHRCRAASATLPRGHVDATSNAVTNARAVAAGRVAMREPAY